MSDRFSKSQIDKLGERLKAGQPNELDLQQLDEYRRTFGEAYETVVSTVRSQLRIEPTGRPAKTLQSIREKLRRESIRLTQMQDVAGCRIIVKSLAEQDQKVRELAELFPEASAVDRRVNPSHGYRAVHLVLAVSGKQVEIQVRTTIQHTFAEWVENYADLDPGIKYGLGDSEVRARLLEFSDLVFRYEQLRDEAATAGKALLPQIAMVGNAMKKVLDRRLKGGGGDLLN